MGALRKQVVQPQTTEIFILPYGESRPAPVKVKKTESVLSRVFSADVVDQIVFELKALAFTAVAGAILAGGYIAYQAKSYSHIDLLPGISISNSIPQPGGTSHPFLNYRR